jgi:hypothetical protein
MSKLHVKPAVPGAVIRDPRTMRALPAEGGRVPDNTFWRRRLNKGEIVELPEPKATPQHRPVAPRKTEE